jgi:xanthine/uracil permease
MMIGPQTEMTAGMAAHGRLRVSHTDREQMIDVLKAAFVRGGLTKDEFDARIGQALAALTYADLAAVIPAGLIGAQSPQKAARTPVNSDVKSCVCAIALAAGSWLATFLTDNVAVFMVAIVVTIGVFLASPAADALMLGSGHRKHSGEQPSPLPPTTPNFMRGPA